MSPSVDQDNNNPTTSNRLPLKATSAGVQVSTKNGKRNNGTAKNSSDTGVLSAVMKKNGSKVSDKASALPKRFPATASAPDMKPESAIPDDGTNPGVTSPLLDALSSTAVAKSSSQNTSEWLSKNIMSSSPNNNLINLGESPPMLPSSYEERVSHFGWNIREQRAIPSSHPASASPPANRRRPISYHNMDGNYPHPEDNQSQISYASRRRSMVSPYPQFNVNPPLPHQAQAHFHGLPDADFTLSPKNKSSNPYHCGFDEFSGENLVVSGYEGGFDLYSVSKSGLSRNARVDGLRGGVYNAKILPAAKKGLSGLIAVVVHGPYRGSGEVSNCDNGTIQNDGVSTPQVESGRGSPMARPLSVLDVDTSLEYYQTTVEVYSLNSKQHVATLLSLPKVPVSQGLPMSNFRGPSAGGSLSIRADTSSIVISSGITGETWIFRQEKLSQSIGFKCIGKVWTTLQHNLTDSTELSEHIDGDWSSAEPPQLRQPVKAPILSLNGRWLAFCPSTPSSQVSIRAHVHGGHQTGRVPGLNIQAPPQLPPVNCEVETPGGESVIKQAAQVITQRVAEGATYLGKQGVQAWNNYWNKPSSTQAFNSTPPYQTHINIVHQFPPTHGAPSQAPPIIKDPGLVSIIDLDYLANYSSYTGAPHPIATFKVPSGVSFLSFAPSGLALFIANSKGDGQVVLDMMRFQYVKSSFLKDGSPDFGRHGPYVRQIAQFSRMTVARVVDVAWTSPHGERAAMVTERGTVHILDLPASAFTWPPPRQRTASKKADDVSSTSSTLSAAGVASNAVSTLWTAARPFVNRRRRSTTGVSAISAASITSQAGHSTQALAAGISRSVGAATGRMNELRKAGNTKLHLPRSAATPNRACIRLLNGKRSDSVLVLGGGVIGLYTIKSRRADRPADNQKASRGAKYIEFHLPSPSDFGFAQSGDFELTEGDMESNAYRNRSRSAKAHIPRPRGAQSSIPQAEIESNAPYQPFHTDRRVGLYIYSQDIESPPSLSVSALLSPQITTARVSPSKAWAFGGVIGASRLDVGPQQTTEDSFYTPSEGRALPSSAIERVMTVTDNNEDTEQIVVTTRKRKTLRGAGNNGDVDEEGFFEDDCEVLDFASQRV